MNSIPGCSWFRAAAWLLVVPLLLAAVGCAHPSKQSPSAISVVTTTEPDGVTVSQTGSNVLIEVRSPRGIGKAWFDVAPKPLVAEVRVRLYLRGLEQFAFSQGGSELRISVASHGDFGVRQSVLRPGQGETPVQAADPLWTQLQMVPGPDAFAVIPLEAGYFELTLPAVVPFRDGAGFQIGWVDFVR